MPKLTNQEKHDLQVKMHFVGRKEFLETLVALCYNAAEDTEDFENKAISAGWSDTAQRIESLIDEQVGLDFAEE